MNDQAAGLRELAHQKDVQQKGGKGSEQVRTRIIAIASGKGGVGKSNVTVNLAMALQELGEKVLIMDADLGTANIDILLGLTPSYNLNHFLKGKCRYEDVLLTGPEELHILPGTSGEEDLTNISSKEVNRLLEASSQMEAAYDIILIDIGAGVYRSVINFTLAADEAIIVLTPEPTSIMDSYSLIKILARNQFKNNLRLLVNQVNSKQEARKVAKRMSNAIKKYLELDVKILGSIPFDNHLQKAVKKQNPLMNMYPGSKAGKAFSTTAAKLVDKKESRSSRGMKGFVYRIIGMFNR